MESAAVCTQSFSPDRRSKQNRDRFFALVFRTGDEDPPGTNFYTFIDTFNLKCQVAKRGKNKQGRGNLRQVSYALFCTTDGHLPLFYDVYEGNRNDAKEFPQVLEKFQRWLKSGPAPPGPAPNRRSFSTKATTPPDNFALIDTLGIAVCGLGQTG